MRPLSREEAVVLERGRQVGDVFALAKGWVLETREGKESTTS